MARTAATPTPVPMAWQRGWIAWTGWWISRARGAVRTRGERRRRARARAQMRRRQRTCRSGRGVHRRGRVTNGASRGLTLFVTWRVPTENRDEAGVLFPSTTLAAKSSKNKSEGPKIVRCRWCPSASHSSRRCSGRGCRNDWNGEYGSRVYQIGRLVSSRSSSVMALALAYLAAAAKDSTYPCLAA